MNASAEMIGIEILELGFVCWEKKICDIFGRERNETEKW